MRRIIVLLTVAVVVAVMVLLAAGDPAMASVPSDHPSNPAAINQGTENAHASVPKEGRLGPGSAGTHTETAAQHTTTAHEFGIPEEMD